MSIPTHFILPGGRVVDRRTYVRAWRKLKRMDPSTSVPGWNWYPVTAGDVLRQMSDGVMDRINRRGGIEIRQQLPKHSERRIWNARRDGVRRRGCRECGSPVPSSVNVNPNNSRGYICPDCQKSYRQ